MYNTKTNITVSKPYNSLTLLMLSYSYLDKPKVSHSPVGMGTNRYRYSII